MKVYELLLKATELMVDVKEGTTTAQGGTTYLIDTDLRFPSDHFNDGVIFITSGTYVGAYRVKANNTQGRITIGTTLAGAVPASVTYSIAEGIYSMARLKQAMNWVLDDTEYMLTDKTETTVDDTEEYDLPTDVTQQVRRVEIATSTSEPYKWYTHRCWDIVNGKLVFMGDIPDGGYLIRIHYVSKLDTITTLTADIPITVDTRHLKYAVVAWLYRQYYRRTEEDHPSDTNLLNEAKLNWEMAKGQAGVPYILSRDPFIKSIRHG